MSSIVVTRVSLVCSVASSPSIDARRQRLTALSTSARCASSRSGRSFEPRAGPRATFVDRAARLNATSGGMAGVRPGLAFPRAAPRGARARSPREDEGEHWSRDRPLSPVTSCAGAGSRSRSGRTGGARRSGAREAPDRILRGKQRPRAGGNRRGPAHHSKPGSAAVSTASEFAKASLFSIADSMDHSLPGTPRYGTLTSEARLAGDSGTPVLDLPTSRARPT
jgi:hypothetical protein